MIRRVSSRSGEPNALALAHSGSGQQRRYAARERLPSGRLGHRSRSKRAAPESRVREDITGRPDADLLPLAYDSKPGRPFVKGLVMAGRLVLRPVG